MTRPDPAYEPPPIASSPRRPLNPSDVSDSDKANFAAGTIQRVYRGYRARRELQGIGVAASSRWMDITSQKRCEESQAPNEPAWETESENPSPARKNWQRVVSIAIQAGAYDRSVESAAPNIHEKANEPERLHGTTSKMMDLPYFLEMVDEKHRHGSNLRAYHSVWKNSPSGENFFYWLDHGEGKNVEIAQCPRERLERDQVRYLSPQERAKYLVVVDDTGRFRWAKNNDLVETDTNQYKDSMQGVVRIQEGARQFRGNTEAALSEPGSPNPRSASPTIVDDEEDGDPKLSTREDYELGKAVSKFSRIKPTAIYDHFAASLPKKDEMWIFVADTSFRIYIGIKEPGAFQHSSFLRGGRISAAGMLKIKHGQLRSLAPLSGHYRPHVANFRAFHHSLQERGVDLSRVLISKSYAILAGIEGYTLTKKKVHNVHEKLDTAKEKLRRSSHGNSKDESAETG
ncbi:hypothetical protein N7532_000811 [Penicillium argentinense]|uniref:IQ calmodulin-binding motif protein n=1 Tax=Penicillium argentinense TaxID=1131581 RepID=A0A9W9G600_9EURO|nr:uncharacterized protein N7532_000811 [Penicillium argentinense]KAJ5112766.1 hypothetical protein N7532_000811 [Penicillium argentinense]